MGDESSEENRNPLELCFDDKDDENESTDAKGNALELCFDDKDDESSDVKGNALELCFADKDDDDVDEGSESNALELFFGCHGDGNDVDQGKTEADEDAPIPKRLAF